MKKTIAVIAFVLFSLSTFAQNHYWSELGNNLYLNGTPVFFTTKDKFNNIYAASFNGSGILKWNGISWNVIGAINNNQYIDGLTADTLGNVYTVIDSSGIGDYYYIDKWNGTTWITLGGINPFGANYQVSNICSDAAGNVFALVDSTYNRNNYTSIWPQFIAKWNGTTWITLGGTHPFSTVHQLGNQICCDHLGNIYVSVDSSIAKWNGASWSILGGIVGASGCIKSICTDKLGNIYAAGCFVNTYGENYVAKWNGSSWSELGGLGALGANHNIMSIYSDSKNNIYATGLFTNFSGNPYVAKWDGTSWNELGGLNSLKDAASHVGSMYSICSDSKGNIFVGGLLYDSLGYILAKYGGTLYKDTTCNNIGYSFGSKVLVKTGTYYDTLLSSVGYDSIITLKLIVHPSYSDTSYQTICSPNSYNFRGRNLTASGIYYDSLKTYLGCDSIFVLYLKVNPFSTYTFSQSICSNGFYHFNNRNINTTGIYYDTITNYLSCDSILTLHLTVLPISLHSFNITICSGHGYLFNGINHFSSGIYYDTLTNYLGCDSIISLHLSIYPKNFNLAFSAIATTGAAPFYAGFTNATPNLSNYNFTWFWGDGSSTNSNSPNVTHTFSYGGFYNITLVATSIATGCSDTLTKTGYIFVTGAGCTQTATITPSAPFVGCQGDTLILRASTNAASSFTYQWNVNNTTITGATADSFMVTQGGNYSVTVLQSGCPVTSSVVQVGFNIKPPTPTITDTGSMLPCVGGTVTLIANAVSGVNYLWSTNQTTPSITVNSVGVYTVAVSYGGSACSSVSAPFAVGGSLPTVPICLVTVDSLSTNNIVVWEKTGITHHSVDSFRVYREVTTNVYAYLASISNDSLSVYNDFAANPNVTSYKYKLAVVDSCGDVSLLSDYHNTIHLQNLGNGNLLWTLYEIENAANPVTYYVVMRDNLGNGNFQPISSTLPGSNTTYTDINYASYPNASYRIAVSWNRTCHPTKSTSTTYSNIEHNVVLFVPSFNVNGQIKVYPNPTNTTTTITLTKAVDNAIIKLINLTGQTIIEKQNQTGDHFNLDISQQAQGIYFIEVQQNGNIWRGKVVKQ